METHQFRIKFANLYGVRILKEYPIETKNYAPKSIQNDEEMLSLHDLVANTPSRDFMQCCVI